jgi:hypothetical protein
MTSFLLNQIVQQKADATASKHRFNLPLACLVYDLNICHILGGGKVLKVIRVNLQINLAE